MSLHKAIIELIEESVNTVTECFEDCSFFASQWNKEDMIKWLVGKGYTVANSSGHYIDTLDVMYDTIFAGTAMQPEQEEAFIVDKVSEYMAEPYNKQLVIDYIAWLKSELIPNMIGCDYDTDPICSALRIKEANVVALLP